MFTKYHAVRRAVLATALLAVSTAGSMALAQTAKVVKLGGILTVTGPNSALGKEALGGIEYAAKTVNAGGGVKIGADTYTVQIVNIDDESKAERTAAAVRSALDSSSMLTICTV